MVRQRVAPYVMARGGPVGFFVCFFTAALVTFPYVSPEARAAVEPALAPFYAHASNFILCFLPVLMSVIRLPYGPSWKEPAIWALAVGAVNVVYEVFLPLWNTRDVVDAAYGVVGSAVGFAVVELLRRHGMKPNPKAVQAAASA